jgi:hypothetical protein
LPLVQTALEGLTGAATGALGVMLLQSGLVQSGGLTTERSFGFALIFGSRSKR